MAYENIKYNKDTDEIDTVRLWQKLERDKSVSIYDSEIQEHFKNLGLCVTDFVLTGIKNKTPTKEIPSTSIMIELEFNRKF